MSVTLTKRTPINEAVFRNCAVKSSQLQELDKLRCQSSFNARRTAQFYADKMVGILDSRNLFQGPSEMHGSWLRKTNTKKPGLSDIDILCYIHEDKNKYPIETMEDFHRIRFSASIHVKQLLEKELSKEFEYGKITGFYSGFVIKVEVKEDARALKPWKMDVIFCHDLEPNNNPVPDYALIDRQFKKLEPFSKRTANVSSLARLRHAILDGVFNECPRLKTLVRLLKHYNKDVVMKRWDCEPVNSFVLEMLVALLFSNDVIPPRFHLNRAFATCLTAIAEPDEVPVLFFKENHLAYAKPQPFLPDARQLNDLRKGAGNDSLVLVDPAAPFSNIAVKKARVAEGWEKLEEAAGDFVAFLRTKGVGPYPFC